VTYEEALLAARAEEAWYRDTDSAIKAATRPQREPKRPYPWCQRQTCDGLGTCPRDPTCGD
jgi:hypothetical protein